MVYINADDLLSSFTVGCLSNTGCCKFLEKNIIGVVGYFVYDFIDIVLSGRTFSSWEVVIHHVLVCHVV